MCPWCIFEAAASIFDAVDLAVTGVRYLAGDATGEELSITAAGAAVGLVAVGGGAGRAGRRALESSRDALASSLPKFRGGRLHGDLPGRDQLHKLKTEDLENFAGDLRRSIAARQRNAVRLGEDGPHRRRIEQELELLRRANKILSGS